ncbi:MAG TPA: hypothetical protein VNT01_10165 [Symbiobacteriaceae bacterium]|nr:hypothetical protein [Symbiobacteriaceae bacterium]
MSLTISQFLWTLGDGQHFAVITENRFHRLNARLHRGLPRPKNQARRRRWFDQQAGLCPYCGRKMTIAESDRHMDNYLTEEHVHPVSKALLPGTNRVAVGACHKCNRLKADRPLLLFVYKLHRPIPA